ncbi:MAG: hypothetical protein DMF96_09315 [Acidobacteria bacterium]|nr:MAG: hypothetical protein DMF96_09315 [Acidobacteriota bacterium]
MVQTQSGERSYAVTSKQIENLLISRNNFTSLTAFTPGVVGTGASAGGTRLGGLGQNNIMMDGISAMDTGNNGQMLNMNVDSIGEVKILTQGYQAEYGRSSGLQITAVTKSGSNRSEAEDQHEDAGLYDRRPRGQAGRIEQAVLLLLSRVSSGDRGHQQRQPHPDSGADGARARRRLLADARQHGRVVQLDQGSELDGRLHGGQHGRLLPGRRRPRQDPGGPPVSNRPRSPEPVPAPQRHAVARRELQLRGRGAHDRQSDPAAGRSRRLSAVVEAAVHGKILRPACAASDHAGHDSGIQRRPESVPLHYKLWRDGGLHDELVDVHRGHVRLHPKPARGRRLDRSHPHGWNPHQRVGQPVEPAGLSAALPECGRGRSALLRVHNAERSQSKLVRR